MWGLLLPTLFTYGISAFEDPVHRTPLLGIRGIKLKAHVHHCFTLADTCFQMHVSFPFVLMNVIQHQTTSDQCCLAFYHSWFPKVSTALEKVNNEELSAIIEKLKRIQEHSQKMTVKRLPLNYYGMCNMFLKMYLAQLLILTQCKRNFNILFAPVVFPIYTYN